MRLARGCQTDLRGRDAAVTGGADPGGDRRPGRPLHDRRVSGNTDSCLLSTPQFPQIPTAHQVLPHVDNHERADADAGVRTERCTSAGDSARGEFLVHGVRGRWHMVWLQSQTECRLCSAGRCHDHARLGAG